MVCVVEEQLPSTRWPLARVTDVHPGVDGRVRVVTLQTSKGSYKRPVTKVVLLPTGTEDNL